MEIAYIAHPIGGDQHRNVQKVLRIIYNINMEEPDVVPFAPYIPDCMCMDDNIPEHRNRGIKNDNELMRRGFIDEIRLYGDRISNGMAHECQLAQELGIPIRAMTEETTAALMLMGFGINS